MSQDIQQRIEEAAKKEGDLYLPNIGNADLVNDYFKTGARFVLNTILPDFLDWLKKTTYFL